MRLTITAALLASFLLCGCSAAAAAQPVDGAAKLSERIEQYATAKAAQFDAESEQNAARAANTAIAEQRAAEAEYAAQIEAESVYEYSPTWTAEYYAPTYAPSYGNDYGNSFKSDGVVYDGGTKYTWYSQNQLPGGGLTELNANGRTVNADGFVVDGDGYIAVAQPGTQNPNIGMVVDTPFGPGKVYDSNPNGDSWDIYTDF